MKKNFTTFSAIILIGVGLFIISGQPKPQAILTKPVLFVTVQPGNDITYMLQTFGNHLSNSWDAAPRGGDLWIIYPEGELRNLTREAGFGVDTSQIQGVGAIAVRQPCVHWDGTKALFSMVIGGPTSLSINLLWKTNGKCMRSPGLEKMKRF